MNPNNIAARIDDFNRGRNPELLRRKYKALRSDPFRFMRGTCHLFYEDWPSDTPLNAAPPAWSCGDLHLENFGCYKGDKRTVYFDINDFGDSILAPCTWDITRLLTSVLVSADAGLLRLSPHHALTLCSVCLDAYGSELMKGYPRMVDRGDAVGLIKSMLKKLKHRDRGDFIDKKTTIKKGRRRLKIDDVHMMAMPEEERARVESSFKSWAATQQHPRFYKLLDMAYRIAGTGSLGLARYALLVEGRGSPDENFLLDVKLARPSALENYVKQPQPSWSNAAERTVAIQQRMQGVPPALLQVIKLAGKPFVLRELQPTKDRISLKKCRRKHRRLERVIETMGRVTAWDQLRSSGRQGSASADALIEFATTPGWKEEVLDYARFYAAKVEADYLEFCASAMG